MRLHARRSHRFVLAVLVAGSLAAFAAAGCGGHLQLPAAGQQDADQYLYQRGTASLEQHHWIDAREYFKRLVDTYPQSPYRQDAKLGIGDSYLGENRIDSDILGANEFREFLQFFPLARRADYAQYRLAFSQVRQVLGPQRDQTATHDAVKELDTFVRNYPTSQYMPDVEKLLRQMHDRLSESEFLVGQQYFRMRYYPGAILRLQGILTSDPQYSRMDAVYYYLAESYYRANEKVQALPWYQTLVEKFADSQYLERTKLRVAELTH